MLNAGQGVIDERMHIIQICEYMGWTCEQYESNPDWFLETLRIKMEEDKRYRDKKQKESNG